jgi:hypothetical protein
MERRLAPEGRVGLPAACMAAAQRGGVGRRAGPGTAKFVTLTPVRTRAAHDTPPRVYRAA